MSSCWPESYLLVHVCCIMPAYMPCTPEEYLHRLKMSNLCPEISTAIKINQGWVLVHLKCLNVSTTPVQDHPQHLDSMLLHKSSMRLMTSLHTSKHSNLSGDLGNQARGEESCYHAREHTDSMQTSWISLHLKCIRMIVPCSMTIYPH